MTLRARMLIAQLPALLVVLALLVWGGRMLDALGARSQVILAENYRSVLAAERMKESIERLDSSAHFRLAGRTEAADALLDQHRAAFEAELRVEESNLTEPGEAEATAALRRAWVDYQARCDRFLAAPPEARSALYFDTLLPAFGEVKAGAQAILTLNQDAMSRRSDEAVASAARARQAWLGWSIVGVIAAVALSATTAHRLTGPLRAFARAAERVGEGQLDVALPSARVPELDQLADALHAMAHRLRLYRRASAGELARARETAQAAIESLTDPVLVFSVAGELRRANAAAVRALGLEPNARRLDGGEPALVEAVERAQARVVSDGRPVSPLGFEAVVLVQTGEGERALLPHATPIYDTVTGELVGVTVLLQDVTRLRRLDELKGNLVNTVAHELRTPLTSLGMALHLVLDERVSGPLAARPAELLEAAREDVVRLRALVEDLLDLSRIQEGRLQLRLGTVAPADLLARIRENARAQADAARVLLELDDRTGGAPLALDAGRMEVALGNLVGNAIRVSPADGRVVVRVRVRPDFVRFEVDDSGPGVPLADRDRIFEPFARGTGTTGGGPGLGLHIAREVVRAHGGRIGVDSRAEGGARFWIELPAAPVTPAE